MKKLFGKYFVVFKLVWIERLVYRVNFFLEILSGLIASIIIILLWIAIYKSSGSWEIGGYSLQEMITYLLGGGLINSFILTTAENPEISQSIKDGNLSTLLIKPLNPYFVWFVRDWGTKCFCLSLGLLGYFVVFLFFKDLIIPFKTLNHLFIFIFFLFTGAILQFLLFHFFSLLAFWIENIYGTHFIMRVIMEVLGGAIIPLSLFPAYLEKIFNALPFQFIVYFPMRIYLGKIALGIIYRHFLSEIIWISIFALFNYVVWRAGMRHYMAMGD